MFFKKIATAATLALAVSTASAWELGVVGGGITGSNNGGLAGVTVGDKVDRFGLTAGFSQAWLSDGDQNRWTVVGSYDVFESPTFTVAGKVGYAYLDQAGLSGSAGLVGVGIEVPLTQQLSLTADYAYQFASQSVNNTSVITGGVKFKF
jgi:outer membrane autotransporter protein